MVISLEEAVQQTFDLIVIGGGINGVAIARDAALRGMKVALFEKDDFGAGASTKTSKLAHGGLRYLEQFEFGLVRESLRERGLLLKNAPHLTRPLPFIIPVYEGDPYPLWKVNFGLYLYDFLGRRGSLPPHRRLSAAEVAKSFPSILTDKLRGGFCYYDAQMLDNRLLIENMLSAETAGACVFNHATVSGLLHEQEKVCGVEVLDSRSGISLRVKGKIVINATGAWSNRISAMEKSSCQLRVEPTKGVHLVIPQMTPDFALFLRAPQDGRVLFIVPWNSSSLLGTTDSFFDGNPDRIGIDRTDRLYLLEALNFYFPDMPVSAKDIIAEFAGLRPLVASSSRELPSEMGRSHRIESSSTGLITVLGGKYTTYRKIAEDAVDAAMEVFGNSSCLLPCCTEEKPLPGAIGIDHLDDVKKQLELIGLPEGQIARLLATYGSLSKNILNVMRSESSQGENLCTGHPHLRAELTYAIQEEHARTLEDWFCRRTSIAYTSCRGVKCLNVVAKTMADLLKWLPGETDAAIASYRALHSH
jgi:glycerol-3-phosphate dehydrogenase